MTNLLGVLIEKCSNELFAKNLKLNNNNNNNCEKLEKATNINIPTFKNYNTILEYNYNIQQLKNIAKIYKLKIGGNKQELISRIYSYFYLYNFILKIQKNFRGYLQRKYNKLHGPAFNKTILCTNTTDFLTMDELTNIPSSQFFSYKDNDNFIYGFDLTSIYNLIYKTNGIIKNPYNRLPISSKTIEDLKTLIRYSKILEVEITTEIKDVTKEISNKKSIELRALTLFQNIDALGNYSNSSWFMELNTASLIKMIRELYDIWGYRAPLTLETKRAICPPNGNPFRSIEPLGSLMNTQNLDQLREQILSVLEKLVNSGIDKDNKCLGAFYVLASLTLVSENAATSLPWLYQAVCYM